jgi:hypothetical protein
MQHEHAHLRTRLVRGERLPVRPDAKHRVGRARVVLGDDRNPHHGSGGYVASTSAACARVT